ncbi:hypothetical protein [Tannerella forsythia]|uniref:hypothetical protein n=1 Tax=Tannerella forsythia TaxID=28112 RepID=UPI000868A054|nr:hypothetical protein [Tannerella forsythia]TPE15449.1 hypothetical protein FJN16_12580 [Tannerella forsythia]SCQ21207.1 hypothetical protein TFUB4_01546 [Tannerella forsythia]
MKIRVFIRKCTFFISLMFIVCRLSAQQNQKKEIEKDRTMEQEADSSSTLTQLRSCVNSFIHQTISSSQTVYGCSNLTVSDVRVLSGGNLSLMAPGEIIINGVFDVMKGGVLNVGTAVNPPPPPQPTPSTFQYLYDASGNRVARRLGSVKRTEDEHNR